MNWAEVRASAKQYRIDQAVVRETKRLSLEEAGEQRRLKAERQLAEAGEIFEKLQVVDLLTIIKDEVWEEGHLSTPKELEKSPRDRQLKSDPYIIFQNGIDPLQLYSESTRILVDVQHRDLPDKKDVPILRVQMNWFTVPAEIPNVEELLRSEGREGFYSLFPKKMDNLSLSIDTTSSDAFGAICELLDGYKESMDRDRGYPRQVREWAEGIRKQLPPTLQDPEDSIYLEEQLKWVMDVQNKVPSFLRGPALALQTRMQ